MARILIVDDEPEIVVLTKKILETAGHKVDVLTNGKDCIDRLKSVKPDLILLDIMMPGIDGWDVCKKIKTDRKTKDIPVVMFTVRTSEDSMKKSFEEAQADAHMNKPFDKKELLDIVQMLLKR